MSDGREFALDLTKFADRIEVVGDRFVQRFAVALFNEIATGGQYAPGTPVDTGHARASWVGQVAGRGESGATALQTATLGEGIEISNPVPYVPFLEFGTVHMAPRGFIRRAVNAADALASDILDRLDSA